MLTGKYHMYSKKHWSAAADIRTKKMVCTGILYHNFFLNYGSLNFISKTREKSMVIKERKMMSSVKNVNEDHYLMKVNIDQSVYFSCLYYLRLRNYNSI